MNISNYWELPAIDRAGIRANVLPLTAYQVTGWLNIFHQYSVDGMLAGETKYIWIDQVVYAANQAVAQERVVNNLVPHFGKIIKTYWLDARVRRLQ